MSGNSLRHILNTHIGRYTLLVANGLTKRGFGVQGDFCSQRFWGPVANAVEQYHRFGMGHQFGYTILGWIEVLAAIIGH